MMQVLILLNFFSDLHVPGHFDEGRNHHQLKTVCIYLPFINVQLNALCICCKYWYYWFFFWLLQVPGHFDERRFHLQLKTYVFTFHLWYSIKCLMHLLTIVYVNIELCCKCWYCWFFFLTFTCFRPFRRGTPSSPVENCIYLLFMIFN